MAKTYVLLDIKVTDPDAFQKYAWEVRPLLESYGARYLIRAGEMEVIEGEWDHGLPVLLEFPDRETVDAFYRSEEYAPLLKLRLDSTEGTLSVIQGYDHIPLSAKTSK